MKPTFPPTTHSEYVATSRLSSLSNKMVASVLPSPTVVNPDCLSLPEVYQIEPMTLVDTIGKTDQDRPLTLKELLTMTDLPGAIGYSDDQQALLLRYSGQVYKALAGGQAGLQQLVDRLFGSEALIEAVGRENGEQFKRDFKEQCESLDLPQFKSMLGLEIQRQAQSYVLTCRFWYAKDSSHRAAAYDVLAREALSVYETQGYLRMPLMSGYGENLHAILLSLERVQTDRGVENLASFYNTGYMSNSKAEALLTWSSRPNAYVGVRFKPEHISRLLQNYYGISRDPVDEDYHQRFHTLTPLDIVYDLARQAGTRRLDLTDLKPDKDQKNGSCSMKASQQPIKDQFPLLMNVVKVIRLAHVLQEVERQQPQATGDTAARLPDIQREAKRQLLKHMDKTMARLQSGQALARDTLIESARVPQPLPANIAKLMQQAGYTGADLSTLTLRPETVPLAPPRACKRRIWQYSA